jgi:hypothetical protein
MILAFQEAMGIGGVIKKIDYFWVGAETTMWALRRGRESIPML